MNSVKKSILKYFKNVSNYSYGNCYESCTDARKNVEYDKYIESKFLVRNGSMIEQIYYSKELIENVDKIK